MLATLRLFICNVQILGVWKDTMNVAPSHNARLHPIDHAQLCHCFPHYPRSSKLISGILMISLVSPALRISVRSRRDVALQKAFIGFFLSRLPCNFGKPTRCTSNMLSTAAAFPTCQPTPSTYYGDLCCSRDPVGIAGRTQHSCENQAVTYN
jgi:hypothetical protein